jgi:hypothetical protein
MKKKAILSIVIASLTILISCSSGISIVNPPSWIIGTWSDSSNSYSYVFDTDNFYYIYTEDGDTSTTTIDFIDTYEDYDYATYIEATSSTLFQFEMNYSDDGYNYTVKKKFSKIDDYTLEYYYYLDGDLVSGFPVELTKQ